MTALIRRLASREVMTSDTLAITFLVYLTGTSLIIVFSTTSSPGVDIALSAVSSMAVFALIFASRGLINRIASSGRRSLAVAATVVLANVIRSLALVALVPQIGSGTSLPLPTRIASSSLFTLAAMLVVGELNDRRKRFKALMTALTAKSVELSLSRATYAERLQYANAELEGSIRNVLDPALSLAAMEMDPDTPRRSGITSARLLQEILRVSVRPMIETLAHPAGPHSNAGVQLAEWPEMPAPDPPRTIDVTDSIRPVLSVVPLRIIGFPVFISTLALGPALRVVAILTLTWPLLTVVRRLWPERYRVLPVGRAAGLLTAVFIISFGLPMILVFAVPPDLASTNGFDVVGWLGASTVLFSVAAAWFVASVFIFERSRRLTEERLIEVNEQIELSIARMRQEIWFTRRNLTWVLHGPVQSALVSATIRLESGAATDPADRTAIWANIAEAYALLSTGGPAEPDFAAFSAELTSLWFGVCEISFHDPDSMIERVSADPSATAALIEVVREAAGNAIRHGDATTVDVTIRGTEEDLVSLVVMDNGTGFAPGAAPGIGSDLFTALTYEWSSESSSAGTRITADLTWSPGANRPSAPH